MKLKSVNVNLNPKYGYPEIMDCHDCNNRPHQIGVAVAIKNNKTDEIECNMLSEELTDRENLLQELLSDDTVTLVTNVITQLDDETMGFVKKTIYYLPYVPVGHSSTLPTVLDSIETEALNVINHFKAEIIFAKYGMLRYLTVTNSTKYMGLLECINGMFDDDCVDMDDYGDRQQLYDTLDILYVEETDIHDEGYEMDFFDNAGNCEKIVFDSLSDIRDTIISIRLIELDKEINK